VRFISDSDFEMKAARISEMIVENIQLVFSYLLLFLFFVVVFKFFTGTVDIAASSTGQPQKIISFMASAITLALVASVFDLSSMEWKEQYVLQKVFGMTIIGVSVDILMAMRFNLYAMPHTKILSFGIIILVSLLGIYIVQRTESEYI